MNTYAIVKQSDLETIFLFPPSMEGIELAREAFADRYASEEVEVEYLDDADVQDISSEEERR